MNEDITNAIIDMDTEAAGMTDPVTVLHFVRSKSIPLIDDAVSLGDYYSARSALDLAAFRIADDEERHAYAVEQSGKIIDDALRTNDIYWAVQTMDISAHFMADGNKRLAYLKEKGERIIHQALALLDVRKARWCLTMMKDRFEDGKGLELIEKIQAELDIATEKVRATPNRTEKNTPPMPE